MRPVLRREGDSRRSPDGVRGAEVINPSTLSASERELFIDRLYQLHCRIFDGVSREEFIAYVIDSPAQWTRIRIYRNERQQWVGYCAVHRFLTRFEARPCVVFRAEAGIIREYRGRSMTLWFGFSEAIKYRLMHPMVSLYYLGSFVHPSVFYMFCKYFHQYYPCPGRAMPEAIKTRMLSLAKSFHIEPAEGHDPMVRRVGWTTRESVEDRSYWQRNPNPVVRYYIETNPGYINGNGLLNLAPLTFWNIGISLLRFVGFKLMKQIRK